VAQIEQSVQDGGDGEPQGADIDRIVETILYLYTESRRVTKTVARGMGLTGPQVTALKILEAVSEISLSELSERMSARNSTITGIVDRMERDGLVLRERSEADRRVVKIRATERGLQIARGVPVTAMELFSSALASLSESDRAELWRILAKLADRVRAEIEDREKTSAEKATEPTAREQG
jgi:MarR family transcriptional regulator, organic hydroperoxide resistance regulator